MSFENIWITYFKIDSIKLHDARIVWSPDSYLFETLKPQKVVIISKLHVFGQNIKVTKLPFLKANVKITTLIQSVHYQSDSFSDEREMENPILCFENWKIKFKHQESRPFTASAKVDLKTKKLPRCRPCPHENLGNFQCNMWFWKNFSGKNQGFWFFENSDKVLLKLIQKLYIEIFHIQDGAFFKTDETVYLWM